MPNRYCDVLQVAVPRVEDAVADREVNTFGRLIACLLERGDAMTLEDVAARLERAGAGSRARCLLALQRCKPGRPPVFREGDLYHIDPHHYEARVWTARLGLDRPGIPDLQLVPPPTAKDDEPLSIDDVQLALRSASRPLWSGRRIALAVLDAHRRPMLPADVIAFVRGLVNHANLLRPSDIKKFGTAKSSIAIRDDGCWELTPYGDALLATRRAVRECAGKERVQLARQQSVTAWARAYERDRERTAADLAALRRVVMHGFPSERPHLLVLADVAGRTIETFFELDLAAARERLAAYDAIAGLEPRATLRGLGFDPGTRRLHDLRPPQKSLRINRQGRTLPITTELLIRGSCGISQPLAERSVLEGYLRNGDKSRLRRRLEADAKSLVAFYEYGLLQGFVRLRWGFLDEVFHAPWHQLEEPILHELIKHAFRNEDELEVVVGSAPDWSEPWSRSRRCRVVRDERWFLLLSEDGSLFDPRDVQRVRSGKR